MLIQLTNNRYEKFYLNSEIIETVSPMMGGTSEIRLTTGRVVTCIESPEDIAKLLSKEN